MPLVQRQQVAPLPPIGITPNQPAAGGINHDVAATTAQRRASWSKEVSGWRFRVESGCAAIILVITATG
jgi:hypothetical protein